MTKQEDIMIPVDDAIDEFCAHLLSHSRTILSARFGDGKSYFIQQLMQSEEANKKFTFLKLYPVNYQVADNKDIFELVKRDILVQLVYNNMIPSEYEVSNSVAFAFYLQNHGVGIVETLLSIVNEVDSAPSVVSAVLAGIKGLKFISSLKEKLEKFKSKGSKEKLICEFLDKMDGKDIYENDAITSIIRDCIAEYQKRTCKRIVLFFEDMDRIDPAHLFRIMNVLSAQMDYCYKIGVPPNNDGLVGNKFGVDNVVLVLDYTNLKYIFAHFYGQDTRMEGYISKFSNKGYFTYSLAEEREKYINQIFHSEIGFENSIINALVPIGFIQNKSLRQIFSAIENTKSQIKQRFSIKKADANLSLHTGILSCIVIMRRLGMKDSEIEDKLERCITAYPSFMKYIGGFVRNMEKKDVNRVIIKCDNSSYNIVDLGEYRNNGTIEVNYTKYGGSNSSYFDVGRFAKWLIKQVAI